MSVRFALNTDRITCSASPPDPATAFTLAGWAWVSVDRDDASTMARLHSSTGAATTASLAWSPDGLGGPNYFTSGGSVTNSLNTVVGEWRKVAWTCAGTAGKVYAATAAGATVVNSGSVGGVGPPTGITLGGRSAADSAEWFNGRLAYFRAWSAELTQAEIEAEWNSVEPVRTSGIWANWPLKVHTDLTDHSGNGRHLIAGTTSTTTEADPPVSPPVPTLTGGLSELVSIGGTLFKPTASIGALTGALPELLSLRGTLSAPAAGVPTISSALSLIVRLGGTLDDLNAHDTHLSAAIGPQSRFATIAARPRSAHLEDR